MQAAKNTAQALIAGFCADERRATLSFMSETSAQDRPNAMLARRLHKSDGPIKIVAVRERQILIATRHRPRQQRIQTVHALQQGVMTMNVQRSKTRRGHVCTYVYVHHEPDVSKPRRGNVMARSLHFEGNPAHRSRDAVETPGSLAGNANRR